MIEAGLPAGVLQFLPGDAKIVTDEVYRSQDLGGLHFTGSTTVFRSLVANLGAKMDFWKSYPRVVGETGGKNFHLLHPSADVKNAALKTLRAAFEYQGQKCSSCSRVYVSSSLAAEFKAVLVEETKKLSIGAAFTDFIGPVISASAVARISQFIKDAKVDAEISVLTGGTWDDSEGFYIHPTIVETTNPRSRFMKEEVFGPFVCIYVYPDAEFGPKIFDLIDTTTEYALAGAIFSKDRAAIIQATDALRFSAGNFYIK